MLLVLKKFFIMSSGASQEILDRPECATESPKFIGIGVTVFLTSILSFLAASYALHLVFKSVVPSLLIGLLWGAIVFNLDRYLVESLRRKLIPPNLSLTETIKSRSRELLSHLPKLTLTVLFSCVIAYPVGLRLFQPEIDERLERHALSIYSGYRNDLLKQYPEVEALQAENSELKQEIQIKQKQTEELQDSLLNQVRSSWNEKLFNERRNAFLRSESELHILKRENQSKIEANTRRLEDLQTKVDEEAQRFRFRVETSHGLVARMEAFNEIRSERSTIAFGFLTLLLLFISLFASPLLVKLFSPVGPYEQFWGTIQAMATPGGESRHREETTPTKRETLAPYGSRVGAKRRPLRVFLCHSSHDKPAIRELHKRLIADNTDPWLDEENILPGQDWNQQITYAVRNCDVVLVCLSRGSVNKKGYVQKEIRFALEVAAEQPEGTIFLIPAKLEECDVPETLRRLQWVNLFEDGGYARLLLALRNRAEPV